MLWLIRLAALSAAIAIAAGAFGAHRFAGKEADWLRTGGFYQLVHAVAVLALARSAASAPLWTLLGGSALFAATLYAMAFGAPRWLGAVTPVGGAVMIAAWLWIAWSAR
ncbi:DUF423 domain-containing protein [Sphingomonas sp. MAH-20]|jgi:uncharacterized membrane protein YgdD (TMEM256/DUF423 family)|uniref:DUF423 domain-containing protein n=1 Tax=Sphingomonas horti TaxID=2682842 RepID=A0A6I4J1E5_9SPHN|nr:MULTISPECIES: DUF423 domain-containing protein [Sphingomonas]MBA2919306.1 DUF423 domain-containing protein [Sphingomonas sp. CGMCC 1.13658]MVO78187.1 DUF423 domain-containing protein [Sphingomonas horti]